MPFGLFGRKISATERDACISYYQKELVLLDFFDREINRYNEDLDIGVGEAEWEASGNRLYAAISEVLERSEAEITSVPQAARSVRSLVQDMYEQMHVMSAIRVSATELPEGFHSREDYIERRLRPRFDKTIKLAHEGLDRFIKRLGMTEAQHTDVLAKASHGTDEYEWKTWREFGAVEPQKSTPILKDLPKQIRGTDILRTLADESYKALAPGKMEDFYRASLIGGLMGAEAILIRDARLAAMWGSGEPTMASHLIEVWTSTVALFLFQQIPNQELMTEGVALGLASGVFESDEAVALAELRSYRGQLLADEQTRAEGGTGMIGYSANALIYLRCLRALGHPLDFSQFPVPLTSTDDLTNNGLVDRRDLGPAETILGISEILVLSLSIAREVFDDISE